MRFRARISKEGLHILYGAICQMQRVGQIGAVFMTPDCFRLTVVTESVDTPRCFCELQTDVIFTDYRIESQSDNSILFEIGLDNLSKALASGKNSNLSQIKLVKRGIRPCLSIETQSVEALALNVTHDIPIRVLQPTEILYYSPPDVPPPTVALELPRSTKLLRVIVEKMCKFSKLVDIIASQTGTLVFKADQNVSAVVKTSYGGLTPRFEGNLTRERDSDNKAAVRMEGRKLSLILNTTNLLWDGAFLFVTDQCALILHIVLSPADAGTMTYYIPVIANNDQEGFLDAADTNID